MQLMGTPLAVFQNLMHLSAVPPPDASNPCWCGDHAIAFTAAYRVETMSTRRTGVKRQVHRGKQARLVQACHCIAAPSS